jgi:predicted kinase
MKSLSLSRPHLIVMVGIPGSGKSFFAEHFAQTFNAPIVSFGRITAELFNEPTYTDEEKAIVGRVADYMIDELFKTEQTIILEGASDSRVERQAIAKRATAIGYQPLFVWVQTESVAARTRSTKPIKGHTVMSTEQFDAIIRRFSPPHETEKAVVISGKHTYASQLKIVLMRLVDARQPAHVIAPSARPSGGRSVLIR